MFEALGPKARNTGKPEMMLLTNIFTRRARLESTCSLELVVVSRSSQDIPCKCPALPSHLLVHNRHHISI